MGKKRTAEETVEFLTTMNKIKLNEVSSATMFNILDKYRTSSSGRSLQRERVKEEAISRAPIKIDFVGETKFSTKNQYFSATRVVFIPYVNKTVRHKNGNLINGIDKFLHLIDTGETLDDKDLEESVNLGLAKKVQSSFEKKDPIANIASPSVFNDIRIIYIDNTDSENKNEYEVKSVREYICDKVDRNSLALDESIFSLFSDGPYSFNLRFEKPLDCRRYWKTLSGLVMSSWGVDISRLVDWHEFMI